MKQNKDQLLDLDKNHGCISVPVDYIEKLGYDGVGELIFLWGWEDKTREDERG